MTAHEYRGHFRLAEYFSDGENAKHFASAIEKTDQLVVPIICLYEVFKKILQERDENNALQAIAS